MLRRASSLVLITCGLLLIALATTVKAEAVRVTAPTDFWYEFTEPTQFEIRTYAVQGIGSDPMLWLYDSNAILLTANDDWYGLQSRIYIDLQPGWYRLRAGVCCGNPDAWWSGVQYDLGGNVVAIVPTTSSTTTTVSTTTVVETTVVSTTTVQETTTSSTVETWPSTTTTSSVPPTSVPETTQPLPISSSTTTTQPDPTTTTSTTTPPTTTEPSTTTTVNSLPSSESSVESSTTSLMPSTSSAVSTTSPTTTSSTLLPPMKPTATTMMAVPASSSSSSTSSGVPPASATGTSPTLPQVTTTTIQAPQQPNAADRPSEAIVEALAGSQDPEAVTEAIQEIAASLETLTAEELDQIVEAVNKAPTEVKKQFEQEVNIFTAGLDNYVPADSNVTVGQRRALVAIGAVLAAAPAMAMRRK